MVYAGIALQVITPIPPTFEFGGWSHFAFPFLIPPPAEARHPIDWGHDVTRPQPSDRMEWSWYSISLWIPFLMTTVLPAWWLMGRAGSWHRNRFRELRLCLNCGYDLRATPDRCPECGTASTSSGQAAVAETSAVGT